VALVVIGLIVIYSSTQSTVDIPDNEISTQPPKDLSDVVITLNRTVCYGTCPEYSIMIYGNGTVIYDGRIFVKMVGIQVYQIPVESVEELVNEFYKINYFFLPDRFEPRITDHPWVITSIKTESVFKKIANYANGGPQSLCELEVKIDELANSSQFLDEEINIDLCLFNFR